MGDLVVSAWDEAQRGRYVRVTDSGSMTGGWEAFAYGLLVTMSTSAATVVISAPMRAGVRDDGLAAVADLFASAPSQEAAIEEVSLWVRASSVPVHRFDAEAFEALYRDAAQERFDAGDFGEDEGIVERVAGQAIAHSQSVDEATDFARYARFPYGTPGGVEDWCPRFPFSQVWEMSVLDERFAYAMWAASQTIGLARQVF